MKAYNFITYLIIVFALFIPGKFAKGMSLIYNKTISVDEKQINIIANRLHFMSNFARSLITINLENLHFMHDPRKCIKKIETMIQEEFIKVSVKKLSPENRQKVLDDLVLTMKKLSIIKKICDDENILDIEATFYTELIFKIEH